MQIARSAVLSMLAVTLPAPSLLAQETPPVHHMVLVQTEDEDALIRLVALDLDLASCHPLHEHAKQVEVIATDDDLQTLTEAGFAFEVSIRNLEEHHERELAKYGPYPDTLTPPLGQGAMGGQYTLAQMVAILDKLAADYPGLCAPKVSLGQSWEGRDIWMVKISDNVAVEENEPEVYYDALHHAREPLSMATTLYFMDKLLSEYGTDPEATYIINNRELFFVPCVNPDGYEYNRQTNPNGGGFWRKNRRNNGDGSFGVDLNRNYATGFGGPGASSFTGSDTYHGPSAFSEPETAAVEAFTQSRNFVQVFSTHTYTDVLLRPWGYQGGSPSNWRDYDLVGDICTATTGIAHGSASQILYVASGTALDHHHSAHGSLGWTAELGRISEGGFWPNPTNTVNIATRHEEMFRKVALLSGPALQDGEIILMSSGQIGTTLVVGTLGAPGATSVLLISDGTANISVPGILGNLLLDPSNMLAFPAQPFGVSRYIETTFPIPNDPALRGETIYWQGYQSGHGPFPLLGNRDQLTLN